MRYFSFSPLSNTNKFVESVIFTFYYSILFNSCSSTDWSIRAFGCIQKQSEKHKAKQHTTNFFLRSQLFSMPIPTPCSSVYIVTVCIWTYTPHQYTYTPHSKRSKQVSKYIYACITLSICMYMQTDRATTPQSCVRIHINRAKRVAVRSLAHSLRLICVSFPRSLPFTVSLSFSCLYIDRASVCALYMCMDVLYTKIAIHWNPNEKWRINGRPNEPNQTNRTRSWCDTPKKTEAKHTQNICIQCKCTAFIYSIDSVSVCRSVALISAYIALQFYIVCVCVCFVVDGTVSISFALYRFLSVSLLLCLLHTHTHSATWTKIIQKIQRAIFFFQNTINYAWHPQNEFKYFWI